MQPSKSAVVDAIIYLVHNRCQWDDLPRRYPNHNSVYYHFSKCKTDGTGRAINHALGQRVRQRMGRRAAPGAMTIDSQSAKTT